MDNYVVLAPTSRGSFAERIEELHRLLAAHLQCERASNRSLQYTKVMLSDILNQHQVLVESDLYQQELSCHACTIVEQAPVDGSKITLLVKTSEEPADFLFHSLRLTPGETRGNNSYLQTMMLFEKYLRLAEEQGVDIATHLVRTWIYVADIDVNYQGVVKARNDIFRRYGLTADTHFIASTGIGGFNEIREASVAIDFLTFPGIAEEQKTYLKALDNLNPTHEYGVAFERGTRLTTRQRQTFFISGTASIDKHGHVIYLGDIARQTRRLLENIEALLRDGGATMDDVRYLVVYLRDFSDAPVVEGYLHEHHPHIPRVLVHAKVCRPEWLVEMECVATKALQRPVVGGVG